VERGLLPRFFERVTRQVFLDLNLDDGEAARYLIDLLTRFARSDALYRVDPLRGRRLETVVDSLLAIESAWQPDSPDWAPEHEQALRIHIGDFTLFMTGIFRDHVERLQVLGLYEEQGRQAYRFASEMARADGRSEAALFQRLSQRFEQYAGALTYMRKVYFGGEPLPWSEPGDRVSRGLIRG
jgi:hypothetical protein